MKLKVCGMKDQDNIQQVLELEPGYMGFIFYKGSPRYVGESFKFQVSGSRFKTKLVGVFVNQPMDYVLDKVKSNQLDYVQLHGNESEEYCQELSSKVNIIKAFGIHNDFDFSRLEPYKPYVKYFLFDTFTKDYGGGGKTFNWSKLKEYNNKVPFFLSGGISLENIDEVLALKGLNIHAVDVNSRFEISPGFKDVQKVKTLLDKIRKHEAKQKV